MPALVALLRGINVGGHRRVKMADLRERLESAGYADVRTHLQSGNVVLRTERDAERVAADVRAATGVDADVLVRTAAQIAAVVAGNPFPEVTDGAKLHVAFLDGEPALPDGDFAPEAFVLAGSELYLSLPGGMRDSPLMKALTERRMGVTATVRNWNTVTALHELSRS